MYFWTLVCKGNLKTVKANTFKEACDKVLFDVYNTKVKEVKNG